MEGITSRVIKIDSAVVMSEATPFVKDDIAGFNFAGDNENYTLFSIIDGWPLAFREISIREDGTREMEGVLAVSIKINGKDYNPMDLEEIWDVIEAVE